MVSNIVFDDVNLDMLYFGDVHALRHVIPVTQSDGDTDKKGFKSLNIVRNQIFFALCSSASL